MEWRQKATLTVREYAQVNGLSLPTVYRGIDAKKIPHVRWGRAIRIPVEQMLEGFEQGGRKGIETNVSHVAA